MINNSPLSKRVICIESGEIFSSIRAAARWANVNDEAIRRVCHGKNKTSAGYHWSFVDEDGNLINSIPKNNLKDVICVETEISFKSTIEAAQWAGVSRNSVAKVCRGEMKTAGGYHWKYSDRENET